MDFDEIVSRIKDAVKLLSSGEPLLRDIEAEKVLFIGDTHGFPDVSEAAINYAYREEIDLIVFIGDYVDRGPMGIENLHFILGKFLETPEKIIILRGNHESPLTNYYYGFYTEVSSKLGTKAYKYYESLFVNLPYIAVVNDWLVVHGGIPCSVCSNEEEALPSLTDIEHKLRRVYGKREGLIPEDDIALQILWNDPRTEISWFYPSMRGEGIYYYGREAWLSFLKENNLKGIIRAHEVSDIARIMTYSGEVIESPSSEMRESQLKGSVITVFSSRYHGMRAGGVVMDSSEHTFKFISF